MQTLLMEKWAKKFRAVAFALIFSGALNIGLLVALIALSLETPKQEIQKEEISMEHLSFRELVSCLTNRQPLKEGYSKRDLALASLVAIHDFNLEKALAGASLEHHPLPSHPQIEVFSGLTEEQFQAVIKFAYEEKWPLTSKGLFRLLQKGPDESLVTAFTATPEFHALRRLFQPQNPSTLIELVREGNWDILERFYKEQELADVSRTQLLLGYLTLHSPTAAHLLIETDFDFALNKLSDAAVLELLRLLDPKTPGFEHYCLELLRSSQNEAVLERALLRLHDVRGQPLPEAFNLRTALAQFNAAITPSSYRTHVVQEGENLWKIARQYGLKLDELVQLNELEKEQIFPGMVLRVP